MIQKAYELMTSNPEECIRLAREALKTSQKHKFDFGMGYAYTHIGLGYYHQGELAQALEHYKLAESTFQSIGDVHGLRTVYNNIGVVYDDWQDCDKALQYYQMNLDLEREGDDPKIKCNILINIGIIHKESRDYPAARQCFQTSLEIARGIGSAYNECVAINNLGKLLLAENDSEGALSLFRQASRIAEQAKLTSKEISSLVDIAKIYLQRGDYPEAINYNHQAMEKAIAIKNKHSIAMMALQFADIYLKTGEKAKQKANLELCLSYAIPEQYRAIAVHALYDLARIYESEGDYQTALKTYWQYQETNNYLTGQVRNQYIEQLRMQMQFAEKEREIELTRKINLALEKKNRLINRQNNKLEKAEKALIEWNQVLEQRVQEQIEKHHRQEQLMIQKSKLEALGRLAVGIAHEINQPVGMINIAIQNLFIKLETETVGKEYLAEKSESFKRNIQRINKIIEHVRLFSRDHKDEPVAKFDLHEVVLSALSMMQMHFKDHNIAVDYALPESEVFLLGNKFRLEQVILNLLANARDALEEKYDQYDDTKRIRIHCSRKKQTIILTVSDNGSGIDEQDREHIFEPFYTTKNENMGTGLGLSICFGIIQEMDGTISCRSKQGQGTDMIIELPALN
ncbi:MAG: tetratricopeptide repeat protein [Candidatus Cloacimonadota bacterium]